MEKEKVQAYSTRITQANRTELVVIVYEVLQDEIADAIDAHGKKEQQRFDVAMERAQRFLQELMGSLDFQYEISYELFSLYKFVNKVLIEDRMQSKADGLQECIRIIENLKIGYEQIADQDTSGPVMRNAQKIYAGLTYGKNSLSEMPVDESNGRRGFFA